MGMSIEDVEQWARQNNYTIVSDDWWNAAQDTINKYQQLQADYENRLKADMAAMLTEIQLEIEESENCGKAFHLGLQMASNIIQQKINELEGEHDPTPQI